MRLAGQGYLRFFTAAHPLGAFFDSGVGQAYYGKLRQPAGGVHFDTHRVAVHSAHAETHHPGKHVQPSCTGSLSVQTAR